MGDHYDCPVTLDGVDAGLDLLGSDRVKAGSRLIEEDDRRVLEEEAGDRYPLLLASGKELGLRLESERKLHDLIVDVGLACSFMDFFDCSFRSSVSDVFLDCSVEDMVLLEDHSDVLAEEVDVIVADVDSVELDRAAVRVIEAHEEVQDSRLAGS